MNTGISNYILAIITLDANKVKPGGCPVFIVQNQEELERTSILLSRILGGIVHDLENGVYFICRH